MTVARRFALVVAGALSPAACLNHADVVIVNPPAQDLPPLETSPPSQPPFAVPPPPPASPGCNLGAVTGDVFGRAAYFAHGAVLAPGRYRVRFVDGCMKYNPSQGWTVNGYGLWNPEGHNNHWWFVNDRQNLPAILPPGNVGFRHGEGGFETFEECVEASRQLPPVDISFQGGTLGVWLEDVPYGDNLPGPSGRSPTWQLECLPPG